MGSTYLDLTNKVLRRLNEVELTSATFASATGPHALAKDAINNSIQAVNQEEFQWPFNHGFAEDTLEVDQATYTLPTNYKYVDWSSFYLKKDTSLSVNPDTIKLVDYHDYNNRYKAGDLNRPSGTLALPERVYRTYDGKYGISPTPDRAYTVQFDYWVHPTDLSAYTDTTTVPTVYDKVIVDGAMQYLYDFRGEIQEAGKSYTAFAAGLKQMRILLINREYSYAYDTRSSQVTNRRSDRWAK